MSPKTVRGKLLYAYLGLVAVFSATGIFVLTQLTHLRHTTGEFFGQYSRTEDLIIATRFKIDDISSTILTSSPALDREAYVLSVRQDLDETVQQLRESILPPESIRKLSGALLEFRNIAGPAIASVTAPLARMEQADKTADECLRQAQRVDESGLVPAIAGIVDAYTDMILTNDPDERTKFDTLVRFVESHPERPALSAFPALKRQALSVFAAQEERVRLRGEFREISQALARDLAAAEISFRSDVLLPGQQHLTDHVVQVAWMVFVAILTSVTLATVISILMGRRIWRPLSEMGIMVDRMSRGDLKYRMDVADGDEMASIGKSLNHFADQLNDTLRRLDDQLAEMTRVESELRNSEAYNRELSKEYQVILDGISESLVIIDQDKNIVWSNRQASEEFYSEIDRKIAEQDERLDQESSYYLGFEQVDLCFKTGQKVEDIIQRDDGRYYRVKVFPLPDESDKVIRVLRILNNITEEYRLREESERSNRLASMGELSAGVAHEINNPNSLVLLNAPIALEAFEDALPILDRHYRENGDFRWGGLAFSRMRVELPKMLDEMHQGAVRIQRIVDDLKNFVRKDDPASLEKVDLNVAVETAVRLTRTAIGKATERFCLELRPDLPMILGNRVQFEQVVVNLVHNACLALDGRDGAIEVRTELDADRREVLLAVRDDGCGIDPAHLKRITDPFFTTRRQQGGTGLGLSVSNRIVKQYGGSIYFDSKVNKGTRVTVRFPIDGREKKR